jgi:hypothetical protein
MDFQFDLQIMALFSCHVGVVKRYFSHYEN